MPSKNYDEKVVSMRFDNAQFKKNVNDTVTSLKRLDKSLELKNGNEGLYEAEETTGKLAKNVDKVKLKFSALQIAATTALATLTKKVLNAGLQITKSLSVDNISAGWRKYENSLITTGGIINNVSKEFSSVGEATAAVAEHMRDLQWYVDETSYSFDTLTDGVKQFTTAGIALDEAVGAARGVTLVAASSKVFEPYKIQSAMDAISKAMQTGYMNTVQWTSLTNTAGVVTQDFANVLLEAAVAEKTLVKQTSTGLYAVKKTGEEVNANNIRDTLGSRWLSKDVWDRALNEYSKAWDTTMKYMNEQTFAPDTVSEAIQQIEAVYKNDKNLIKELGISDDEVETLKVYTAGLDELSIKALKSAQEATSFSQAIQSIKDAAGTQFQQMFQKVLGDSDNATKLWTKVANILYYTFIPGLQKINDLLDEWNGVTEDNPDAAKGFEDIYLIITNLVESLKNFSDAASYAFDEVFGGVNGNTLKNLTSSMVDWTEALKNNETLQNGLRATFKIIFSVLKAGYKLLKSIIKIVVSIFKILRKPIEKIYEWTVAILDWISVAVDWVAELKIIEGIFAGISYASGKVASGIKKVFDTIRDSTVAKAFVEVFGEIVELFKSHSIVDAFNASLEILWNTIKKISATIGNGFVNIWSSILYAWKKVYTFLDKTGFIKVITEVWEVIKTAAKTLWGVVGPWLKSFASSIVESTKTVEGMVELLKNIAKVLLIGGILYAFIRIGLMFAEFGWVLDEFRQTLEASKWAIAIEMIKSLAIAMIAFGGAMYLIGKLDVEQTKRAFLVIAGAIAVFALSVKLLTFNMMKVGKNGEVFQIFNSRITGAIAMALGLMIYFKAITNLMKTLREISEEDVKRAILVITQSMALFAALTFVAKVSKSSLSGTISMLAIALVLDLLVNKFVDIVRKVRDFNLTKEDIRTLYSIIEAVAVSMFLMAVINRVGGKNNGMLRNGMSSIIVLFVGVSAMLLAIKEISKYEPKELDDNLNKLKKVILSVIEMLGVITIVSKMSMHDRHMKGGLFSAVLALTAIIGIIYLISNLDWSSIEDLDAKKIAIISAAVSAVTLVLSVLAKAIQRISWEIMAISGALAIAVASFVFLFKSLAAFEGDSDERNQIAKEAVILFGEIAGIIVVAVGLMGLATRLMSSNVQNASVIAVFIGALTIVIGEFIGLLYLVEKGGVSQKSIWTAAGIIGALGAVLAGCFFLIELVAKHTAAAKVGPLVAFIVAISLVIGTFIGLLFLYKAINDDSLIWKTVGLIAAIMAVITISMAAMMSASENTGYAKVGPMVVMISAIAIIIGAFVGLIFLYKNIEEQIIWKTLGLLSAVLGAISIVFILFAVSCRIASDVNPGIVGAMIAMMASIVLVFGIFTGMIFLIKNVAKDDEVLKKTLISMGVLFGMLSVFFLIFAASIRIISGVNTGSLGMVSLVLLELVSILAMVGIILYMFQYSDWKQLAIVAGIVAGLFVVLFGFVTGLAAISAAFSTYMPFVTAILASLAGIILAFAAILATTLVTLIWVTNNVDSVVDMLSRVGDALIESAWKWALAFAILGAVPPTGILAFTLILTNLIVMAYTLDKKGSNWFPEIMNNYADALLGSSWKFSTALAVFAASSMLGMAKLTAIIMQLMSLASILPMHGAINKIKSVLLEYSQCLFDASGKFFKAYAKFAVSPIAGLIKLAQIIGQMEKIDALKDTIHDASTRFVDAVDYVLTTISRMKNKWSQLSNFASGTLSTFIRGFFNANEDDYAIIESHGDAIDGFSNTIKNLADQLSKLNANFILRPTLDLSYAKSQLHSLEVQIPMQLANIASNGYQAEVRGTADNSEVNAGASGGTVINNVFNQYNYSPEALDNVEIARKTEEALALASRLQ